MLRSARAGALAAALTLLAVGCGGTEDRERGSVAPGGDEPAAAALVDAADGLCQAAARPEEARALFFDRSHDALHTVARRLEDVDRAQAAGLLQAKERVESGLEDPDEDLQADLARLADVYRASLARLAITAPSCDK